MKAAPRWTPAVVTVALAGLTALSTLAGPGVLAAALFVSQVLFLVGWQAALDVPDPAGGIAVPAVAAFVADELVVAGAGTTPLTPLTWVLGGVVVASFVAQLVRSDGRPSLASSLAAAVFAASVAVLGAMTLAAALAARDASAATALVSVGVLGAVAGALTLAILPPPGARAAPRDAARALAVPVVGALVGAAAVLVAAAVADLGLAAAAGTGLAGGLAALVASSLARGSQRADGGLPMTDDARPSALGRAVVAGSLPILLLGPMLALLARLVWG